MTFKQALELNGKAIRYKRTRARTSPVRTAVIKAGFVDVAKIASEHTNGTKGPFRHVGIHNLITGASHSTLSYKNFGPMRPGFGAGLGQIVLVNTVRKTRGMRFSLLDV